MRMIWPTKPSPQSIMGMMGLLMVGCVSIKTHEKGVLEAYKKGLERSSGLISKYECADAKWLVRSEITGAELQELGFK